ncbi:MAG: N-acetylmuramoyl-L-alanine amidase [Bacteroidales bacterium]|nr:N-acetylmuramoyl-L-alanine amidase [Bacteroidales bacterium]MBQ6101919.1 N-acetylmuramoyl-L-alanine amidase [Bacteroidales bacterium]
MSQRNNLKFGILLVAFLLPFTLFAQRGEKITTVVIDPGHGGKDTGALGAISKEKDLNLTVALLAGDYIKKNLPDVNVIYTRERDVFVGLNERAMIANRNNADVFISIHCNSTDSKSASVMGAETFVLGEHKNAANLQVAKNENSAILYEEDASEQYGDFDLNSPEAYIALSLFQQEYLNQSLQLAANVQEQFSKRVGRKDRGVQQAGFLVLWKTAMPSILIELGFISNAAEERFLASESGQIYMASAIYRAFRDFKMSFEGENSAMRKVETEETVTIEEPSPAVEEKPITEEKPIVVETPVVVEKPVVEEKPTVSFKVQFFISDTKVSANDKRIANIKDVDYYEYNGSYRYTSGDFRTKEEAFARQKEVQKQGYPDAWVVCFINGERVSMREAEDALERNKRGE